MIMCRKIMMDGVMRLSVIVLIIRGIVMVLDGEVVIRIKVLERVIRMLAGVMTNLNSGKIVIFQCQPRVMNLRMIVVLQDGVTLETILDLEILSLLIHLQDGVILLEIQDLVIQSLPIHQLVGVMQILLAHLQVGAILVVILDLVIQSLLVHLQAGVMQILLVHLQVGVLLIVLCLKKMTLTCNKEILVQEVEAALIEVKKAISVVNVQNHVMNQEDVVVVEAVDEVVAEEEPDLNEMKKVIWQENDLMKEDLIMMIVVLEAFSQMMEVPPGVAEMMEVLPGVVEMILHQQVIMMVELLGVAETMIVELPGVVETTIVELHGVVEIMKEVKAILEVKIRLQAQAGEVMIMQVHHGKMQIKKLKLLEIQATVDLAQKELTIILLGVIIITLQTTVVMHGVKVIPLHLIIMLTKKVDQLGVEMIKVVHGIMLSLLNLKALAILHGEQVETVINLTMMISLRLEKDAVSEEEETTEVEEVDLIETVEEGMIEVEEEMIEEVEEAVDEAVVEDPLEEMTMIHHLAETMVVKLGEVMILEQHGEIATIILLLLGIITIMIQAQKIKKTQTGIIMDQLIMQPQDGKCNFV